MSRIEKKDKPLHFISAAYVNGFLWTSALEWNGYYRISIENKKIEFLGLFKYADVFADKLFNQVLSYLNFVFFIPWFSDYLVRLDTDTLETKSWKLPENIILEFAKFRAANVYNNKIFMFPHCGNSICIFNIQTEKFECNQVWLDDFLENVKWNEHDKFLQGCQKEDTVWLPNLSGNFMMKFNFNDYQYEMIVFPDYEAKIVDIVEYNKNNLLILTSIGNIWKYNIDNKNKELFYEYDGEVVEPYRHILIFNNKFYLVPSKEKNIKILDNEKQEEIIYPQGWELKYEDVGMDTTFNGYYQNEDEILLYPCFGNSLIVLNKQSLSAIEMEECSKERKREIYNYIKTTPDTVQLLYEPKVGLESFFNIFIEKKNNPKLENKVDAIGEQIWNIMKGI